MTLKKTNPINQPINSNIKKKDNKVNAPKKQEIDNNKTNSNSIMNKKDKKQEILDLSEIISKENSEKIIRKYPNRSRNLNNCKIILFIGENQDAFINTLINICTNVEYKDNYRYQIESPNLNGALRTIYVTSISDDKYFCIISFPSFNSVEELFDKKIMGQIPVMKINYLFITVDKRKFMDKKQLIYFLYFMNLLSKENLSKRIIILFSSEKDNRQRDNKLIINDIFKDSDDDEYFLSEEILGFNFNSLFTPEYFFIDNKIIYEKNNIPEEEQEFRALSELMKNIQKKISSSVGATLNNNNISLINQIIKSNNKPLTINIPELKKINKKEDLILLFNYLITSNIKSDISAIIIYLMQKIYDKIRITKGMTEINFKDLSHLPINIAAFSKIEFNNLQKINFQNCGIVDQVVNMIQNIFTPKLLLLNLSENKLDDLKIFSKENIFNNLNILDLSHNNIVEINNLMIGKFPNLKKLNLSHNKISNIKSMDNELHFNRLEELDLSYNSIKELNRINIPCLKFITLTNNTISEGLINFSQLSYGVDELILINNKNELNFTYSKIDLENNKHIARIAFNYVLEKNKMNPELEKVNFNGINKLVLEGFENIDFLANDSLKNLKELDLRNNPINDISTFYKVKFADLQKLLIKENIDFLKGFGSLVKFYNFYFNITTIKHADDKYKCNLIYNNDYQMNFIFDDLDFFKEELLYKSKKINLEQSIWDDNIDYFFEAIKNINSYPLFKMKPEKLDINSKNGKYEVNCKVKEFYSNLNMHFFLSDLNIFTFEFFKVIKEIDFNNVIFNDNINLFQTSLPFLEKIHLYNNTIESLKILSIINEMKGKIIIESNYSNKCDNKILEFLDKDVSMIGIYNSENKEECIIKYNLPFYFCVIINKKRLNEIKSFNSCTDIILNKFELTNDDINFLQHDTLLNLKQLILDENKITNIEFLDKIKSDKLSCISIKNNLINDGLKYIDDNIKSEKLCSIKIKRQNDREDILKLSLNYNGNYQLNFDMFYEVNLNLEILKQIDLGNIYSLNLSNLNLSNIDFLSNQSLSKLNNLKLDNNKIEDISIFSNVSFMKIDILSIKNNPIRKGLHVLKNDFFKQNKYIYISSLKEGNEYKIFTEFGSHKSFEFFINDIDDIKNIFDFEYYEINLKSIDPKYLINEEIKNQCSELYDKIKTLLDKLKPQEEINESPNLKPQKEINDSPNLNIKIENTFPFSNEYIDHQRHSNISDEEVKPYIIIDNGTDYCKAGLCNEEGPRALVKACVGYPKYSHGMICEDRERKNFFVGNKAYFKRGVLKINYPIEHGIVNDWNEMEKIWDYVFTNELRVDPKEHNVVITEALNNPKENREKISQIMFETYNVPCLYIAKQPVLSLYSEGKFDGTVIDSGEGITQVAPIFDGYVLSHAATVIKLGGGDLTKYLMSLLSRFNDQEIIKDIKEKSCYVSYDYEEELKYVEPYNYELPDGTHVIIKDQRIKYPEALFKPNLIGEGEAGLAEECYYSIQKCDIDIRKYLYYNIVLSGGNTIFKGLKERLTKDIRVLAPESMKEEVRVISSYMSKFAIWIGGSILSTISSFESNWITKTEYEELGATIVHRKCF